MVLVRWVSGAVPGDDSFAVATSSGTARGGGIAYADTGMPTAETLAEEISRLNE